ncbi:alpha/beta hydrolase [Fodinicola feengrottensis]|uniref:alpha/beta hydrolase n=1 Tax=Fodinicola feengrottensis TaxID=435914 RepID=UPI0024427A91|nr:alpha/beta hydrolase-fold protein [Fodinicola feengrottensis]
MPEGGPAGFYSNWWNHGERGAPAWETFHLTELRQLLERGYGAGTRRVIAGLSMGGFGALSYAARHPGMFRAAASYSGVIDTTYVDAKINSPQVIMQIVGATGADPSALWGATRTGRRRSGRRTTPPIWCRCCVSRRPSCLAATDSPARTNRRTRPLIRWKVASTRKTWRSSRARRCLVCR